MTDEEIVKYQHKHILISVSNANIFQRKELQFTELSLYPCDKLQKILILIISKYNTHISVLAS